MGISLETVKELREKTGAGMMDCKKALQDASGDVDTAIENLRKKGLATAAKKSGRIAAEGTIADSASSDGKTHYLVEVNCETDFVTKTDDFKNYAAKIADLAVKKNPKDLDALMKLKLGEKSVEDYQTDIVAKIGEKIHVRRFESLSAKGTEKVAKYIHPGSKIISLVLFDDPNSKLDDQLGKEVAMHAAAMNPSFVNKEEVPESFLAKEREICAEQVANEKKPAEIMEKIIAGKINKQLAEMCLEDQMFVKDPDGKNSVKNALKKVDAGIKIKAFVRLQVGEGVEKKKSDLAQEVADMIK